MNQMPHVADSEPVADSPEGTFPRVLLADDHVVIRKAMAGLLRQQGFPVVGEVANGRDAVTFARELHPDVILMDVRMPIMSGVDATRTICQERPNARILMLTASEEDEDLVGAIRSGARGYLLKNADDRELFHAINAVAQGDVVLSASIVGKLFGEAGAPAKSVQPPAPTPASVLTPREEEVLQLIARGANNREIARLLTVSEHTVKTHTRNILEKLQLHNRTQAALYAKEQLTPKE